jgi:hypothetical protein
MIRQPESMRSPILDSVEKTVREWCSAFDGVLGLALRIGDPRQKKSFKVFNFGQPLFDGKRKLG